MTRPPKIFFSRDSDPATWATDANTAFVFAVPRRWWSLAHWRLVNGLLRQIKGFVV